MLVGLPHIGKVQGRSDHVKPLLGVALPTHPACIIADEELKEMSARALAGLAVDEANRQGIARAGGMVMLMELLTNSEVGEPSRSAAGLALANLSLNPRNRSMLVGPQFLPKLADMLAVGQLHRGSPLREAAKMVWLKVDGDPTLRQHLQQVKDDKGIILDLS